MKFPDPETRHDWMDDRVEAYVDGELSSDERATFERVLDTHSHWQRHVRQARRIRHELRALPKPACPPQVTQTVLAHARSANDPPSWASVWRQFWDRFDALTRLSWQPVAAMAMLVLIVVASVWVSPTPTDLETTRYSAAEVERAEAQAKWALAYVAQVGTEAQGTLQREVFQEQIADPTRRALRPLQSSMESTRNR